MYLELSKYFFRLFILSSVLCAVTLAAAQTRSNPEKNDEPISSVHARAESTEASTPEVPGAEMAGLTNETTAAAASFDKGSDTPKPPSSFDAPVVPGDFTKKQASSSDWKFGFAPYLYMTGLRGTIGARGRSIEVDASFGNVLENLDLGLMGAFEAQKGKLIFLSDIMWIKMSAERDTPGGLYADAKLGVNLSIIDPESGYRLAESSAGSFDVLGGARIWSVENNLNVRTGILPGFDVSQRKTWAAPVVGFRGVFNITTKFYASTKFDIGGAGIGADLTTQFYGGVGYRITPRIAIIGGYRYLQVDYDDSDGFIFDTRMNGFLVGAKFDF